jgi:hypothetical protein
MSYGPSGPTIRIESGYPVYFPCRDELRPPPSTALIVPARAVEQIVFAAPARALPLPPPLAQSAPRAVRGHQAATYGDVTPYLESPNRQNNQSQSNIQFKEGHAWRQLKSISIGGNWPK